jgi:ribose transport system substrate-binding protein
MKSAGTSGRALAGSICALGLLLLAACGSSSSGSSATSARTSRDQVKAKALALITPHLKRPTLIPVKTPVPGKIPPSKTIDYINCGLPSCAEFYPGFVNAFNYLHWKVVDINSSPTPQDVTNAFNQVLQNKPSAVVDAAFPASVVAQQLKTLGNEHIPVVTCCVTNPVGNGLTWVEAGSPAAAAAGALAADWILANKGTAANAAWIQVPAYPIVAAFEKGFKAEYKRLCPSCGYADIPLSSADVGTPAAQTTIVGYLQAHPDINYVAAASADFLIGLPAAIDAAGLKNKVSLTATTTDSQAIEALKQHDDWTGMLTWYNEWEYKIADVLARIFVGASTAPDQGIYPRWFITSQNVDQVSLSNFNQPNNLYAPKQFEALWHVG